MASIYILHHVHEIDEENEDVKLIGAYSSEEKANEAMSRLSNKPGFNDVTEGFVVTKYEIDKDHWSDGFITK